MVWYQASIESNEDFLSIASQGTHYDRKEKKSFPILHLNVSSAIFRHFDQGEEELNRDSQDCVHGKYQYRGTWQQLSSIGGMKISQMEIRYNCIPRYYDISRVK